MELKDKIESLIQEHGFQQFYKETHKLCEENKEYRANVGVSMDGLRRKMVRNFNRVVDGLKQFKPLVIKHMYTEERIEFNDICDNVVELRAQVVGVICVANSMVNSFEFIDLEVDSFIEEEEEEN